MVVRCKDVPGAAKLKKRLMLVANVHRIFQCPIGDCEHEGFRSQRGCRKHVTKSHLGYSILTNTQKILWMIKLRHKTHVMRRPTNQRIVVRISFQMASFSVKRLLNECAALPVLLARRHAQIRFTLVFLEFIQYSQDVLMLEGIKGP